MNDLHCICLCVFNVFQSFLYFLKIVGMNARGKDWESSNWGFSTINLPLQLGGERPPIGLEQGIAGASVPIGASQSDQEIARA